MGLLTGLLANPITALIDKLVPDKAAADAAKAQLVQMEAQGALDQIAGQIQTNITEAANPSVFVSGWRPFVGWVCGMGLAYSFLLAPIGNGVAALWHHPGIFPSLDLGTLLSCLGGMLGLGLGRTVEKITGVASK